MTPRGLILRANGVVPGGEPSGVVYVVCKCLCKLRATLKINQIEWNLVWCEGINAYHQLIRFDSNVKMTANSNHNDKHTHYGCCCLTALAVVLCGTRLSQINRFRFLQTEGGWPVRVQLSPKSSIPGRCMASFSSIWSFLKPYRWPAAFEAKGCCPA